MVTNCSRRGGAWFNGAISTFKGQGGEGGGQGGEGGDTRRETSDNYRFSVEL